MDCGAEASSWPPQPPCRGRHPAVAPLSRGSGLVIRGAREHNLRGVDLDLPRDSLIVFTGLSGSGKSSLAFDTIFAEGQRRYVESLSRVRAPVPRADGQAGRRLHRGPVARPSRSTRSRPTATRARRSARSPRSTTTCACSTRAPACRTARCAGTSSRSRRRSRSSTRCWRWRRAPGSRCSRPSCAPARASSSTCSPTLQTQGYSRVLVDGTVHQLTDPPTLKKQEKHDISVVVDRLAVKAERQAAAHRLGGDGAAAGRRARRARLRRPARRRPAPAAALLRADGLPERPPAHARRPRAAHVLLQLALRRVPGVRRHRASRRRSTPSWWSPTPS